MDFRFEDAGFDGGVLLRKLGGLFRGNAINGHAAQIARIRLRELPGEGQVAFTGHLLDELGIAVHGVAKGGAVGVPVVATVEKDQGILLHFGRVGRSVNGGGVNGPRPVHLCDEATGFDRGIAIREFLCLRERVCDEDKNAAKRSVVQERSGDNEFVFVVELADVGLQLGKADGKCAGNAGHDVLKSHGHTGASDTEGETEAAEAVFEENCEEQEDAEIAGEDAACWKNSFILPSRVLVRRDYRIREGLATTGNPGGEGTPWLDRENRWG
jgi:hypothetical protein